MFFVINKIVLGTFRNDTLQNPNNSNNPLSLSVLRQLTRTALFSAYSKKAWAEFWDETTQKKIARRSWTPEMIAFANAKIAEAEKPPYTMKITIVGWLFFLVIIAMTGLIIFQEVKPDAPKSAEYIAMEKAPVSGDIYFGRFEAFKEANERVASETGFGWFKVIKVEGDTYYVAKSTQMNKSHKSKEELNSTDFEIDGTPSKITGQAGYSINLKSLDGKLEIYFTDKK